MIKLICLIPCFIFLLNISNNYFCFAADEYNLDEALSERDGASHKNKTLDMSGAVKDAKKKMDEFDRQNDKTRKSISNILSTSQIGEDGKLNWVSITIEGVWAIFGPGVVEKFTLSNLNRDPDTESPGYISDKSTTTSSLSIHAGYNRNIAGKYRWTAQFGRGSSALYCNGIISVSGKKQRYNIRVYNDCRDAGSNEY